VESKALRRQRSFSLALAGLLLLSVSVAGIAAWQWISAREAQKKLRAEILVGGIVYEDFALGVDTDGPGGSVAQDPNWQQETTLKYLDGRSVDSRKIPFIALPMKKLAHDGVSAGDYVIVLNTFNGQQSIAVVGDIAPDRKQINVSLALANLLGIQFDLKKQTVRGDKIVYLVFPGSGSGHCPESPAAIHEQGQKLFNAWGGISNLRLYLKSSDAIKNPQERLEFTTARVTELEDRIHKLGK
jgi:hypothetical protein